MTVIAHPPAPRGAAGSNEAMWAAGVLAAFLASLMGSLGDNMVRKAFVLAGDKARLIHMWRSPLWVGGMFSSVVLNASLSLVGLHLAPATIVTSFAGVHIMWNTVFAKTWNREKTTAFDYTGTASIIIGVLFVILYSGKSSPVRNIDAFVNNLKEPGPLAFIILTFVVVSWGVAVTFEVVNTSRYGEAADKVIQRASLAAAAGLCGGLSNVSAKALLLLTNSVQSKGVLDIVTDPSCCIVVALTISTAVAQVAFLNTSLQRFEAIYVVPAINSTLIASGALGGVTIFKEEPIESELLGVGVFLVILGVTLLSVGKFFAESEELEEGFAELLPRNVRWEGGPPGDHTDDDEANCMDILCKPLTDASVDVLIKTNTLSVYYPDAILNSTSQVSHALRSFDSRRQSSGDSFSGLDARRASRKSVNLLPLDSIKEESTEDVA